MLYGNYPTRCVDRRPRGGRLRVLTGASRSLRLRHQAGTHSSFVFVATRTCGAKLSSLVATVGAMNFGAGFSRFTR